MTYETLLNKLMIDLQNIGTLRGRRGEIGPQGKPGVQGPKGEPGKQGTTFTPHITSEGQLSWTNDGNLINPLTVNIRGPKGLRGEKGLTGEPGRGLTLLGTYSTLNDLKTAVPTPSQGDIYNVGTSAPYDLYMWDDAKGDWLDIGQLQGVKGDKGDTGDRYNISYAWDGSAYKVILYKNGAKANTNTHLYFYLSYNPQELNYSHVYNGELRSADGQFTIQTDAPLCRVEIFDRDENLLYSGNLNRLYRGDEFSYGFSSLGDGFEIQFFKNGALDTNAKYLKVWSSSDPDVLAITNKTSITPLQQVLNESSFSLVASSGIIYSVYIEVYSNSSYTDFQQSIFIYRPYRGPKGDKGEKGETGDPINVLGTYSKLQDLISSGNEFHQGDMYLIGSSDTQYTLYMWDTTSTEKFISLGTFQGPKGEKGSPGESLFYAVCTTEEANQIKEMTSISGVISLSNGSTILAAFENAHSASTGRPSVKLDSNSSYPLYIFGSDDIPSWQEKSVFIIVFDSVNSRFVCSTPYATTNLAGPVKLASSRVSDSSVPTSYLLDSLITSLEESINSILNPSFIFTDPSSGKTVNYSKSYQDLISNLIELELHGSHVDGTIAAEDWVSNQVTITNNLLQHYDAIISLPPGVSFNVRQAAISAAIEVASEGTTSFVLSCANGIKPTIDIPYRLTFLFKARSTV